MTGVMIGVMVAVLLFGVLGLGGHHGGSAGHHGKMDVNEKQNAVAQHDNTDMKMEKLYPQEAAPLRENKRETTIAKYDAGDEKGQHSEDVTSKAFEGASK